MRLSSPLEELIAPERASVLGVLERAGQPLTGRTIAALTGKVSQTTTSRLLIELGRHGLVVKVPGGYELNREHLAYRALEVLFGARDELQRRVGEDVAAWEMPPVSVVLFGSVARRQETLDSDIDLLVVRPATVTADDELWAQRVADLSVKVGRWCGTACEILEYTPAELAALVQANDPLAVELLRDGITLAGMEVGSTLGKVSA